MLACLAVRPFITTRKFRTVCTAAADAQLDPLLDKCWTQLNWLNMNTDGGMKRSRQKVDNVRQKRASLVDKEGTEFGWQSEIEGIVADNPRKIRGDRCERLIFEEAGSAPTLVKSWVQGQALVDIGGIKVGCRIAGGTGGDSGPQLVGLSKMFYNPKGYEVLPFKHCCSRDGKAVLTGYFIAAHQFAINPEYLDERGVTDSERFKEYYEKRWKMMDDQQDIMIDKAEHCFTPEDALIQAGDNIFDSVALAERLTEIKTGRDWTKPKRVRLLWDKNEGDGFSKVTIHESPSSELLMVEPTMMDPEGKPYKNLYVAGIDSIDMGARDSATDNDVSDFCIVVKKRAFGMSDPKYVAMYKARPNDIREAYDLTIKLLTLYNCQAMLEYTKISIQQYFRDKHKEHLLMSRPEWSAGGRINKRARGAKRLVGVSATESVIRHGLELISHYINDYWHQLDFPEMIDQMLNYSYELKRKFDIIAALSMTEIGDEELTGVTPKTVKTLSSEWKDIGWYTDESGHKVRGVIPKQLKRWPT